MYWTRPRPRQTKQVLAPANERDVRARFWKVVDYRNTRAYWIAWVPERGHFEIDVPDDPHHLFMDVLAAFWLTAPTGYRYVVYANDGTRLFEHTNGKPDVVRDYVTGWVRPGAPSWRSQEQL